MLDVRAEFGGTRVTTAALVAILRAIRRRFRCDGVLLWGVPVRCLRRIQISANSDYDYEIEQ